jgi:hypothetical protein
MLNKEASAFSPADQAKVRCFGSTGALTVEATLLQKNGAACGDTVSLDVAPKDSNGVQWDRKITLQLSTTELPILAAVCLGYLPKAQFKRPDKGIVIERQDNKLYVCATQGAGNNFSLPVPIGQAFQIASLLLIQLQKQTQLNDGDLLIAALRGSASLYKAS